jgi:hypothetical protein
LSTLTVSDGLIYKLIDGLGWCYLSASQSDYKQVKHIPSRRTCRQTYNQKFLSWIIKSASSLWR